MTTIQNFLNNIHIIKVPKDANFEIEARILIDGRKKYDIPNKTFNTDQTIDIAKKLINKYNKNQKHVNQSINFLKDEYVKQMTFIKGEQQKDKLIHYKKNSLIHPVFLVHDTNPAYRLAFTFEIPIDEFPLKDAKNARIRLRYVIQINELWKLDITLVKVINDLSNPTLLKSEKTAMLFDIDTDNFIDKAPWNKTDMIEFELEYTGDYQQFNIEDLLSVDAIFEGILDIKPVASANNNTDSYQNTIYTIAKYLKPKIADRFRSSAGLKQLSNQVIELNKSMYLREVAAEITNYYITDKVDGKRTIIYINGNNILAVSDKLVDLNEIKKSDSKSDKPNTDDSKADKSEGSSINVKKSLNNAEGSDTEADETTGSGETTKSNAAKSVLETDSIYILDTEFYNGTYYIFDIMVFEGDIITELPFSERHTYFEKAKKLHTSFRIKPFIKLTTDYKNELKKFKASKKPYEVDGIILTPEDGFYNTMKVYKYKPSDKMSIDFLIKKCPDKLLGISPYIAEKDKTLYLLFCGMSDYMFSKLGMSFVKHYDQIFNTIDAYHLPKYFPVQFQPSNKTYAYIFSGDEGLEGEVGEFVYHDDKWHLHKIREDRRVELARGNYFGNDYRIAENIWMAYSDPLVIEELSSSDSYFQEHDNQLQKSSRNFNSFVKSKIFEQFKETTWVIDLASGKGQDLFRYGLHKMRNVVFLEIDNMALSELLSRKYDFVKSTEKSKMSIMLHQIDLNEDHKDNFDKLQDLHLPSSGVDLMVCNFAFHYFIPDRKHLMNIIKFINHYLKPGGRFVFTAFDGRAIIRLLNENNGNWTVSKGKEIKYSIKKQYKINVLEPIGQKIDVLLPFSNNDYYSEYLVNIEYIASEFSSYGITLETDQSFEEYLIEYKNTNYKGYNTMDADDRKYSSLYHYYCFYKQKTTEKVAGTHKKRQIKRN